MPISAAASRQLRKYATPLMIGTSIIMVVTGLLLFFHQATGLNKPLHEYGGWAMTFAILLHIAANEYAFKGHLKQKVAQVILVIFVTVLIGSFFIKPDGNKQNPAKIAQNLILNAPLSEVAALVDMPVSELEKRLEQAGLQVTSPDETLKTVTGNDHEKIESAFDVIGSVELTSTGAAKS